MPASDPGPGTGPPLDRKSLDSLCSGMTTILSSDYPDSPTGSISAPGLQIQNERRWYLYHQKKRGKPAPRPSRELSVGSGSDYWDSHSGPPIKRLPSDPVNPQQAINLWLEKPWMPPQDPFAHLKPTTPVVPNGCEVVSLVGEGAANAVFHIRLPGGAGDEQRAFFEGKEQPQPLPRAGPRQAPSSNRWQTSCSGFRRTPGTRPIRLTSMESSWTTGKPLSSPHS